MDFEGDTVHSVQFSHAKPQSSSEFSHVWVKLGRSLPTGAKHFLGLITTLSATAGILLNPFALLTGHHLCMLKRHLGNVLIVTNLSSTRQFWMNLILILEDDASTNQSFLFA